MRADPKPRLFSVTVYDECGRVVRQAKKVLGAQSAVRFAVKSRNEGYMAHIRPQLNSFEYRITRSIQS